MARKTTDATQPTEATVTEAFLLGLADLIYATFGNPATAPAPAAEKEAPAPAEVPVEEPEEDDEPAEEPAEEPETEPETADEVDADEDEDLEAERAELEKLSLAALRKKLVDLGYDPEEVKTEKDKATLVEAILSDEDDDEDDEDSDEDSDDEAEDEGDEGDDYTAEELEEMSLAELKEIAAEMELEIAKGARAATYRKAILEAQEIAEDTDADEDEDDAEEADEEELEKLTLPELRKVAKETYGLTAREIKGLDKDGILDLIFEDEDEEEDD